MEPISFTSKLPFKEYANYSFFRFLQSWLIWFIYIGCVYMICFTIFSKSILQYDDKETIVILLSVLIIIPISAYFRIRKAYKSNPFSGTEIYWTISEFGVAYQQGSVSGEVGWDRINKITESKKWTMIWSNKKIMFYFQNNSLSPTQLADIKKIMHRIGKGYFK